MIRSSSLLVVTTVGSLLSMHTMGSAFLLPSSPVVVLQQSQKYYEYSTRTHHHMSSSGDSAANNVNEASWEEVSRMTAADETTTDQDLTLLEDLPLPTVVVEVEAAAAVTVPLLEENNNNNKQKWFDVWLKRLNTQEDAFSIHKLSAIIYTATSFSLMGIAMTRWLLGRQDLFATLPPAVEPITYAFILANLSMCIASIRMAYIHRRNDLASRNAFIGTAGSSIFSAYFLLWASPFAPLWMITPAASQIGFGILVAWNVIFVTDTMIQAKDIIEGRRDKKSEEENANYALEYLRYIATGAWGLPVVAITGYISCILHDHAWMMNVFQHNFDTYGHGLSASVFYNNVIASMAAAYGSLFVTLRDKKLVSKQQEWIGIALFALPALIWTIDVSVRVFPYWTGGVDGF